MGMNNRLLRPRASGFNPKSISGLAFWVDVGVTSSITLNGSTVSQINDLSGNGRSATQATAARQPTYSATDANGKPAMTVASGNRNLETPAWTFLNTATVFAVVKNTNNSFGGVFQRGAVNERHAGMRNSSAIVARRADGNEGTIAYTATDYNIVQWTFSAALSRVSVNGATGTDNTTPVSFAADAKLLRLMSLADGLYGLVGGLAELLYYEALLTDTASAAVRSYLSKKFGISST